MNSGSDHPLKVLFLASEAEPFYKVGGLGDYSGSLPAALKTVAENIGIALDIRIGLPFHKSIAVESSQFQKISNLNIPKASGTAKGSAYLFNHNGIPHYFIRRSGKSGGFSNVYSQIQIDNARKFIFFSLASLELTRVLKWQPDIIHANDWHTALAAHHLKLQLRKQPFFSKTRSLLVIHNLPFMGAGSEKALAEFGIPPIQSNELPDWSWHFPLVLGIDSADKIAAVSPSYMQELKLEEFGNGLKDYFITNETRTFGILNGIDTESWNPETDELLTHNYSVNSLDKKIANKRHMQQLCGFEIDDHKPLLVAVTRLDIQKGTDLIMNAFEAVSDLDWNMVILGTGDKEYENTLLNLQTKHPHRLRVFLEFNANLAHQLYAAGDIFLMPSRYEPCGLSQMIAMRYGNLPVARAVGGLRDTIVDKPSDQRTGYLFEESSVEAFSICLKEAIRDFQEKDQWRATQERAMQKDYSWEKSAAQYLQVYQNLKEDAEMQIRK